MDQDAGLRADRLPVDVGDRGLEHRPRRPALHRRPHRETDGGPSLSIEGVGALRQGGDPARFLLLPPPAAIAEVVALGAGDLHRAEAERSLPGRPGEHRARHGGAEEVAGLHGGRGGIARKAGCGIGGGRHQELRRPVLRHPVVGGGEVLPLASALELQPHRVAAERRARRDGDALGGGAERRRRDGDLAQRAPFAVLEDPVQAVGACRHGERAEVAVPHDGLGVDRLARAVDAPLGEDRRRERVAVGAVGGADVEAPRRKVGVVAGDAGEGLVVAITRHDVPLEAVLLAAARVRDVGTQDRDPVGGGAGGGADLPGGAVERHRGARPRLAVGHARDPDHAAGEADLGVHGEVGHLHDGVGLVGLPVLGERRAGDLHQLQDGRAGPLHVVQRQLDAEDAHPIARPGHPDAGGAGALEHCGEGAVVLVPAVVLQHGRDQPCRHRRDGHGQGVDVHVLDGEGAERRPLDGHPAVLVLHQRRIAGGPEARGGIAGETLPEDVGEGGRRAHRVGGVRRQRGLEVPGLGGLGGIRHRERHLGQDADAPLHVGAPDRGGELEPDAAGGADVAAATARAHQAESGIGLEAPADEGPGVLGINAAGQHQLPGAVEREGPHRHQLNDPAERVGAVVAVPPAGLLELPGRLVIDGALAADPQRDGAGRATGGAEFHVAELARGLGAQGRGVDHLEGGFGRQEPGMFPLAHRQAGQQGRSADAKGVHVGLRQPAPVHRLEGAGDGDRVAGARGERGRRQESKGHRVPPFRAAGERRRDPQQPRRVDGAVERARHGPVEDHLDRRGGQRLAGG